MAIRHLLSRGIGFSPGGVDYIITRGLSPLEPIEYLETGMATLILSGSGISAEIFFLASILIYAASDAIAIISGSDSIEIRSGDDDISILSGSGTIEIRAEDDEIPTRSSG